MVTFGELWAAAGVLVGLQVTALTFRVGREIDVGASGDLTWLPIADCVNMLSLSLTLIGVFVLPVLTVVGLTAASRVFGLAALLLVGYAFALAGHYEMFNPTTGRSIDPETDSLVYFPRQERVVAVGIALAVIAYIAIAVSK